MAKVAALLVLLVVLLVVGDALATRESGREGEHQKRHPRRREEGRGREFEDLQPRKPKEVFRSEGGRIEAWDPNEYPALCDAEIGVKRLTLERNGLAVPCYKDAPVLKVITRGSAKVGIINPLTDKVTHRNIVFNVKKGDVIALPRGTACWLYNDKDERTEVLEVADTSNSQQCGFFQTFQLAGGKQQEKFGSVLHGFSKEMLAHAWNVEEETVQRMLEGQKGAGIIKVDEKRMSMPDETSSNTDFMDYVYRASAAEPDVRVRNAGELRLLNSFKLPVLRNINMAAACVKMEGGALTAPGWIHNAHTAMYVDGGNGRIQLVRENGEQALDTELEEGSLVIIPANYPCVKLAGDQGFRYAAIFTNDRPIESYLAGRNSVYKGMPQQVISSAFHIDAKLQQQLAERRREEAYLFPRRETRRRDPSLLVGAI